MERESKILIVDDNKVLTGTLQVALKLAGFSVIVSNTGRDGLKKAAEESPDLVVLDVNMPKKNGFEVLADLHENTATKDIPVIFLSGENEEATVVKGLMAADDYMVKPFSALELEVRIRKILGRGEEKYREGTMLAEAFQPNRLAVQVGNETYLVPQKDIFFIEAMKNYCFVHMKDRKFLAGYSIGELEERFKGVPEFLRIHRSYIINIDYVNRLRKDSPKKLVIVMCDDNQSELRVSESYGPDVKSRLGI